MTDTKLREARIARAKEMAGGEPALSGWTNAVAHHLLDLIESDWRPEPEVDAVTLAAREWGALCEPFYRENYRMGRMDGEVHVQAFRAGHAHALANHPDTRRMDWLERQLLTVTGFAGSTIDHRGYAVLVSLRTKIDRAMGGGQ